VNVGLAWGTGGGVGVHAVKVRVRRKGASIRDGIDGPFCDVILGLDHHVGHPTLFEPILMLVAED